VVVDGTVYTAGQIALDPVTGEVVGKTAAEQTERVLRNLAAVLEAAGSSLGMVVKTTVYLADMADFPAMNEVYAKHFGNHKPARRTGERMGTGPVLASYGEREWPPACQIMSRAGCNSAFGSLVRSSIKTNGTSIRSLSNGRARSMAGHCLTRYASLTPLKDNP